jgi:Fe-S-cluster containining protein
MTGLMYPSSSPPREVSHPKIKHVDPDIFAVTFAPDCMTHACQCRDEDDRQENDACCQHGADVLIPEKEAILRRTTEIASVLIDDRKDPAGWFDERDPELDPNAPFGIILRTAITDLDDDASRCVFLLHTGERGCGLHRAALVHGFDPAEIKPVVCRLYPLSWEGPNLGLSPDFDRYSCAGHEGPTVYRLMRGELAIAFGPELVAELDRIEAEIVKRRLPVLMRQST